MRRVRTLAGVIPLLSVVGCGAMPDFVLETVRDSAKTAFEQQLEQLVNEAFQGILEEVDLPLPFSEGESEDDAGNPADAEDDAASTDVPDRTTR